MAPGGVGMELPGGVAGHLEYLRLRGRAQGTIVARRRALTRMAAALPCELLEALPADLLAWRARMRLGTDAIRGYVSHAHQFYAWAVAAGLLECNPAAGLPVPPKERHLPRPIGERDLMTALAAATPRIRTRRKAAVSGQSRWPCSCSRRSPGRRCPRTGTRSGGWMARRARTGRGRSPRPATGTCATAG
jgi:hypothetical protein